MANEETQKPMGIIVDWISHLKNTLGLSETNFKYIFLSYNNEGLMSLETIENTMKKYGIKANKTS